MSNKLNPIINKFIVDFNKMCVETGRNKLVKHTTSTYEGTTSTSTSNYAVTYGVKHGDKKWEVIGKSKGFWIFKKKFPLFTIEVTKNTTGGECITFNGLYTSKSPAVKATEDALASSLASYLENCKSIPVSTFTNV